MYTQKIRLADEDMRGRLIGREGRNIRSFEAVTTCSLIVDDRPNIVELQHEDAGMLRIGQLVLLKLLKDGRIHPTRIEKAYAEISKNWRLVYT